MILRADFGADFALESSPALADAFPDVVDVGPAPRRVRPLAVRIAEEEARLARREVDRHLLATD